MNVVVMSSNPHGRKAREISSDLIDAGVAVQALIGEHPRRRSLRGELLWHLYDRELRSRLVGKLTGKVRGLLSREVAEDEPAPVDGKPAGPDCPVHFVSGFNSTECVELLRDLNVNLLVLGGTGIIRNRILLVPDLGTVNVHMGLLPDYRGMNVAEWAFLNGDRVGLTVHFVDRGVDSGDVIASQEVDVSDCASIEAMRIKLSRMQHVFMAQVVRRVLDREVTAVPQPLGEGKQYYVMHRILRRSLEEKLSREAR